ncbi:MAG: purine permease [Oligoflexales bacterium]|nr:purine permease [Oligoflexales bacterium]
MCHRDRSKIDDKITVTKLVPLGLQHVLAMYAGAIIVPLLLGGALKLTSNEVSYLVSADLFTCGMATLLQTIGIGRFIGIRLPVVLGCSFTAVSPMIAIGSQMGIRAIYGAIIGSGALVFLSAPFLSRLTRFFPPVVIGSIMTVIGLSLTPVAMNHAAGGAGSAGFGSFENLLLSGFVLLLIVLINRCFKGFLQAISVLLGIIVGSLVGAGMGIMHFGEVAKANWVNLVVPFSFGFPTFHLTGILTMWIVVTISMIESIGVFIGTGRLCNYSIEREDLVRGLRAEGLAQILGGIFNAFPYTAFAQNTGLLALTKVSSRYVVVAAGMILMIFGVLPKFAALTTIIPIPVLGGAMLAMFGMVAVSGIRILNTVDFNHSPNMLIAGCSLAVGLGIAAVPGVFDKMPELFRILFSSSIISGSIVAIVLNILMNWQEVLKNKEWTTDQKLVEHNTNFF